MEAVMMYVIIVDFDGIERYYRAMRGITCEKERLIIHDIPDTEIELSCIYYFKVVFVDLMDCYFDSEENE